MACWRDLRVVYGLEINFVNQMNEQSSDFCRGAHHRRAMQESLAQECFVVTAAASIL